MPEETAPTTAPTTGDDIRVVTAGQEPTAPTATEPATTTTTTTEPADGGAEDVKSLPPWAQTLVEKLRGEAGKDRTEAKRKAADEAAAKATAKAEAEAAAREAKAVEATKADVVKAVLKALGQEPDEGQKLTPEQVVEQITRERDEAKSKGTERDAKYRELLLEVAVQDGAAMHDARADRLLDSRAFMKAVGALDPDSEGYRPAIAEAIKAAVEADGDLKATKPTPKVEPPAASGGTTVAGTTPTNPEDMSPDQFIAAGIHRR